MSDFMDTIQDTDIRFAHVGSMESFKAFLGDITPIALQTTSLGFMGLDIIEDRRCPENQIWFFDSNRHFVGILDIGGTAEDA